MSKFVKWGIKIALTSLALYFVFQKIAWQGVADAILSSQWVWLIVAFLLYNLSKIIAAQRLSVFYKAIQLHLPWAFNLRIYYLGMFYNLFLPGGIGGDAYKVYLLQSYGEAKVKTLTQATILDRLSGLLALGVLACIGLFFTPLTNYPIGLALNILALILSLPFFYGLLWYFKPFKKTFIPTTLFSFGVQLTQVICSLCILQALEVNTNLISYLVLFLVSSVVSVLPLTIGGVGARELVFLYGVQFLPIQEEKAVTFTLLFFGITALSSLIGLLFISEKKQANPETTV